MSFKIILLSALINTWAGAGFADEAAADYEIRNLARRVWQLEKDDLQPVINRLVYLDSEPAAIMISGILNSQCPRKRTNAAWVLGFLKKEAALPAIRAALQDEYWEVRRYSIIAVGEMSDRKSASLLAQILLSDPKKQVRLEAAKILEKFALPETADYVRRALRESGDKEPIIEAAIIDTLGAVGESRDISLVQSRLLSENEKVRNSSLRALTRLGDPDAEAELIRRMKEGSADIRRETVFMLKDISSERVKKALLEILENDEDQHVLLAAAEVLAFQDVRKGLEHLLVISAFTGSRTYAGAAAKALGRLGLERSEISKLRREIMLESLEKENLPVDEYAVQLHSLDREFKSRLKAISARFLGLRYMHAPLGEGGGYDPGPLFRRDGVDCLTFIEQVIALVHATDADSLIPILNDIRYSNGLVSYGSRNHLMEHQWLPNNISKGWFKDITVEVGGDIVEIARKEITESSWKMRRGTDLSLEADEIPFGVSKTPYIPIERFSEVMGNIPDGAILIVIRHDFRSRPFRVTHLGFVFHINNRPHLRHAARATYMSVIDENLETFARRNRGYFSWPVSGFNIILPLYNGNRALEIMQEKSSP